MKTRREFFRTLAGSFAVLTACVVAPKSLIAKEEKLPGTEITWSKPFPYATSGYAQIADGSGLGEDKGTLTTSTSSDDSWITMQFTNTTGWTNYGRRKGDSNG